MKAVPHNSIWMLCICLVCAFWVHLARTSNLCKIRADNAIRFQLGGKCFEYVSTKMDWDSAVEFCTKYGGYLAKTDKDILNADTAPKFLKDLKIPPYGHSVTATVGFLTRSTATAFWLDGSQVLDPQAPTPNRCGLLHVVNGWEDTFRFWEMQDCRMKWPIICQYEPAVKGVSGDVTADVLADVTTDVPADVTTDVPADVITDVPADVTTDVPADVISDVSPDVVAKFSTEATTTVAADKTTKPISTSGKTVIWKSTKSTYIVGKPLSERTSSVVTSCVRVCMSNRHCVRFNYNTVTHQCQLFDAKPGVGYRSSSDWSVWIIRSA